MAPISLERRAERVMAARPIAVYGKIADVVGLTIEATGPPMFIGDLCYIRPPRGGNSVPAEVVGFRGSRILLMPLGDIAGIAPNSLLEPTFRPQTVRVGLDLLGRVIGSMGNALDGRPTPTGSDQVALSMTPPSPLSRRRITEPLATGVRSIDGCITIG